MKNHTRWRALALISATLVLSWTTWFSAAALIPQLRAEWHLSNNAAAWLTIAVQLGFVCGALVSSLLNLSDLIPPRHMMLVGSIGAATANGLLDVVDGPAIGIPLANITYSLYALLASSLAERLRGNRSFQKGERYFAGLVYVGLGITTALTCSKK